MTIQCQRCKKEFKYNYLLKRHLNCKHICVEVVPNELKEITKELTELKNELQHKREKTVCTSKNICKFCNKSFSRVDALSRHLKNSSCKLMNDNISIYERELNISIENTDPLVCRFCKKQYVSESNHIRHISRGCKEKDKYEVVLEKKVLKKRNKAAQNIQHQTINNNNNYNTININMPTLRAFGDENLDYITTKYLIDQLSKCGNMNDMSRVLGNFTRMIHANPAHPENHNVLMRSLNGGYAKVFNGTSFEDRQAIDVQDQILNKVGDYITKKVDFMEDKQKQTIKLNARKTNDLEDMLCAIEEDIKDVVEDGVPNKKITGYRNKVKSTLYTNKGTISSTQRLIDGSSTDNLLELEENTELIEIDGS